MCVCVCVRATSRPPTKCLRERGPRPGQADPDTPDVRRSIRPDSGRAVAPRPAARVSMSAPGARRSRGARDNEMISTRTKIGETSRRAAAHVERNFSYLILIHHGFMGVQVQLFFFARRIESV